MPTKVKLLPKSQRPRERLILRGAESLTTQELLAVILGSGSRNRNVLGLAQYILRGFGTKNLPSIKYNELRRVRGLGQAKACAILASVELGKRIFDKNINSPVLVENTDDVLSLVSDLRLKKKEYIIALLLNSRNELIAKEEIAVGGSNANFLSPSDLFRPALEHNASQIIIVHNHPSGRSDPSPDDLKLTARFLEAGKILGIPLLDHVVICLKESLSLRRVKPELFTDNPFQAAASEKNIFGRGLAVSPPVG